MINNFKQTFIFFLKEQLNPHLLVINSPSPEFWPYFFTRMMITTKVQYSLSTQIRSQGLVRGYPGDLSFLLFFLGFSWVSSGFPSFWTLAILFSGWFPGFRAPGDLMARPYGKTPTVIRTCVDKYRCVPKIASPMLRNKNRKKMF